jgi:SAM-dependent methyltransferase
MCHSSCIEFGRIHLTQADVNQKSVIEVGSFDVNGSLRPLVRALEPAKYVGVDIQPGPGVDIVCDINDIVNRFGAESFDLAISTEVLEHVPDWRIAVMNLKRIVKPYGLLLITTRSLGFPYHGYPHDYWRYELNDIQDIFSDFEIKVLQNDPELPGVFLKAQKPLDYHENDLTGYQLYSMVAKDRIP